MEDLAHYLPEKKVNTVKITTIVDSDLAPDLKNWRKVTGVLMIINKYSIQWYMKHHYNMKTMNCRSELVATIIATDLII